MKIDNCFILGIGQRSGTNFLARLLQLHPDCSHPGPIWEDFVVHNSDILDKFVQRLYSSWQEKWCVPEAVGPPDFMMECLGDGLIRFLNSQMNACMSDRVDANVGQRVLFVTKTPSVRSIENFPRLFPQARLIVIVRDGRAVVESRVKSFSWNYEVAMMDWARSARAILRYKEQFGAASGRMLIVKYEDLHAQLRRSMELILQFLSLDSNRYDFQKAATLDVTGSSDLIGTGEGVHWKAVAKAHSFSPLERYESWPARRYARYCWIAGKEHEALGYELELNNSRKLAHYLTNRFLDLSYYPRILPWYLKKGIPKILHYGMR